MILKMKKVEIAVLKSQQEELLIALQKFGNFMLVQEEEKEIPFQDQAMINDVNEVIDIMRPYVEKKSFIRQLRTVTLADFMTDDEEAKLVVTRVKEIRKRIVELENNELLLKEQIAFFKPWKELPLRLSDTRKAKYVKYITGFIDEAMLNECKAFFLDKNVEIITSTTTNENSQYASVAVCLLDEETSVLHQLQTHNFIEVKDIIQEQLIADVLEQKGIDFSKCQCEINDLYEELKELSLKYIERIEILNDKLLSIEEVARANVITTMKAVYLLGWVAEGNVEALKKVIDQLTPYYEINIMDPSEEDNQPTILKNNELVKPFESITEMFTLPSKSDIDPNPVMGFWYWLTFGVMMGDVGYGIVMILFFYFIIKAKKPKEGTKKFMQTFMFSGVSTIIWGILFGSYFGFEYKPILFAMMDEPLKMLIFSLGFGLCQIISALVVSAYKNYKEKHYVDIIFDQVSWIALLVGIAFIAIPGFKKAGIFLAIFGGVIILVTGGRHKKKFFGKIMGGFGSLYGIINYMGDILSYSRLLALGLSTNIIGMVMNMLAGMIQGSVIGYILSIPIYIIGHTFNIAMGLLSAYVHDSRLQYIEFFGKFYEGGGTEFKPLTYNLKYIDEIKVK